MNKGNNSSEYITTVNIYASDIVDYMLYKNILMDIRDQISSYIIIVITITHIISIIHPN